MLNVKRQIVVLALLLTAQSSVLAPCASANIFEKLFSCKSATPPQTVNYGQCCETIVSDCNTCAPQTCAPQVCAPQFVQPMAIQQQPIYQQPAAVAVPRPTYAPTMSRTSYRTNWIQTPVTYYRPTTVVDPTTGIPVTTMRACTANTLQPQRVRAFRPFFGLFQRREAVAVPAYAAGSCSSCGGSAVAGVSAYGQPVSSGCSSCSSGIPAMTQPGATLAPVPAGTVMPGPASTSPGAVTVPGGATPADQPPSLSPSGLQSNVRGYSRPSFVPPAINSAPTSSLPVGTERPADQGPPRHPRVNPVPDPDATRDDGDDEFEAPELLDPRDRTAVWTVRQAWAYTPVTWPEARVETQFEAEPTDSLPDAAEQPLEQEKKWDTGGWHSIR